MLIGDIKMNVKYKVTYYLDLNNFNDEGIAFGENMGDIVNNIAEYYGEDTINSITIELTEDWESNVIPRENYI